ncbi:MAG: hypothetical protein P4L40_04565, partial [Terracidiphilus sp.]|nr:hypothetical protein [Terracidiphilus sp.]
VCEGALVRGTAIQLARAAECCGRMAGLLKAFDGGPVADATLDIVCKPKGVIDALCGMSVVKVELDARRSAQRCVRVWKGVWRQLV